MAFKQSILFLIALSLFNIVLGAPAPVTGGKQNIIVMIGDGMGPDSMNLARVYKQYTDNLDIDARLNLDPYLIGSLRTRSSSSLITDSAAAGTAFAVGQKTYNGAISVDDDKLPIGSLAEALKLQKGYKNGVVVKSTLTDATPSVWGAHNETRKNQDNIAEQLFGEGKFGVVLDYMSGGGKCYWVPKDQEDSCRKDDRDLIAEWKDKGYTFFETKPEFDEYLNSGELTLPALSFWGNEDVDYVIDRNSDTTPTLADQSRLALNTLTKATADSDSGFFLMIEGSLIDHCGHDNDAACHPRETIEFDDAFAVVKEYVDNSDIPTIVLITADHSTGGLALGYNDMESWYPEVLFNKSHSSAYFESKVLELNETDVDNTTISDFIKDWVVTELQVEDATEEEIETVLEAVRGDGDVVHAIGPITSNRAAIGWTTGGHTNVDVNLYAYTNSEDFEKQYSNFEADVGLAGNHDNTELNAFLAKLAGVDLNAVTEQLRA
ncbi:repressible alkaline phosphatase [[Candida] jaroonii]|uniref:Repressible alkaline phosphatase n=1 Tax=[Candida] jaroonii TaxID=467808 RepID=A0ACA9Y2Z8_9ASCO|nr:repressible alkaline phosphatase [[Candida] jaroonii]